MEQYPAGKLLFVKISKNTPFTKYMSVQSAESINWSWICSQILIKQIYLVQYYYYDAGFGC